MRIICGKYATNLAVLSIAKALNEHSASVITIFQVRAETNPAANVIGGAKIKAVVFRKWPQITHRRT
jgi:hypothetical protein